MQYVPPKHLWISTEIHGIISQMIVLPIKYYTCRLNAHIDFSNTHKLKYKRLVTGFQPRWPGFAPGSGQVGLVVDKLALGQVFSEYFGSPANLYSTKLSILTNTRGMYSRPINGRRADCIQLGLNPPLCEFFKLKYYFPFLLLSLMSLLWIS
jgi:hypothetical protein